jgi:hypothetical protein
MKCKEGKSTAKPKPGRYRCKDCDAVAKKKKEVCEPKKIRKSAHAPVLPTDSTTLRYGMDAI